MSCNNFWSNLKTKGNKNKRIFYTYKEITIVNNLPNSVLSNGQSAANDNDILLSSKTDISIKNIFSLFPTRNLSNYNIYINYAIITGFLILILPDFKGKAFNSNFWKNNIFFKSLFSKIFFFVVLPIPVFIGFSYLLYKEELKETTSTILQTLLIGGICAMYSYLFIVIKNIASIGFYKLVKMKINKKQKNSNRTKAF